MYIITKATAQIVAILAITICRFVYQLLAGSIEKKVSSSGCISAALLALALVLGVCCVDREGTGALCS